MNEQDYKPITFDVLKSVVDHLRAIMPPKIEEIYLTKEEWESLCNNNPVHLNGQVFPIGAHKVRIVTAEERDTILKLKQQCDDLESR